MSNFFERQKTRDARPRYYRVPVLEIFEEEDGRFGVFYMRNGGEPAFYTGFQLRRDAVAYLYKLHREHWDAYPPLFKFEGVGTLEDGIEGTIIPVDFTPEDITGESE